VRTCTIDCAQNTLTPHFGDQQPGETHHHSPVNVHTLGVVNCGSNPMKLHAHTCSEDKAKKGGNNVASLVCRQLFHDGFLQADRKHVKESNFAFDNCGSQNKNRMVLRMLLCLARRKVCDVARAVFLVKGHAKKFCDMMFDLMKKECRKKNLHAPNDGGAGEFEPTQRCHCVESKGSSLLQLGQVQCMNKTEKAKANHIFACTALEPFALQVQEHWEVPITKQHTVKKHSVAADWGNPSNKSEETQGRQGEKEATGSIKRPLN